MRKIIIGTRGSQLAVKQTESVIEELREKFSDNIYEIKKITTTGDIRTDLPMQNESLKKMFVKEIEQALIDGEIDIAVHSMKDMAEMAEGLVIGAVTKREDCRDVLISLKGKNIFELPLNCVVGTSSIRRRVQAQFLRRDIIIKEIRGNIQTRIAKLENGEYDAIILAAAGLKRCGLESKITSYFDIDEFVPAPAQGALCIQCKKGDNYINSMLKEINDEKSFTEISAEREFSRLFNGGCKVPIGAYGSIANGKLILSGMHYNGETIIKKSITGDSDKPLECAKRLHEEMLQLHKGEKNFEKM